MPGEAIAKAAPPPVFWLTAVAASVELAPDTLTASVGDPEPDCVFQDVPLVRIVDNP